MEVAIKEERYANLDGLRALSSVGIVMMHVLANGAYELDGFVFTKLIPSCALLVFLFMIISGFSMCCGYYERVLNGTISPNQFYSKRFAKIWPFFALLTVVDVVVSPSKESLYEAFANLTLCYGLLPNHNIEVIGVGWTLGVIFVFYIMFPFVCFLIASKKRAWLSLGIAFLYNFACTAYFFDGTHMPADFSARSNILYCGVYFLTGCMIYLYRDVLSKLAARYHVLMLLLIVATAAFYYFVFAELLILMALYSVTLIYVIGLKSKEGILNNKIMRLLGKYSMEVYLSHMFIYRVIEKLGVHKLLESQLLSYTITALLTFVGSLIFAHITRLFFNKCKFIKSRIIGFLS